MTPVSPDHNAKRYHRWPASLWLTLAALLAASLYWLTGITEFGELGFNRWQSHHGDFLALVKSHPVGATLAVFLLHAVLAALALPGASLLMLVAGSGFGAPLGTLLCLSGCTAGATLSMLASRHWLDPLVRRRYGPQLAKFDARVAADGASYLLTLRLLPVLPFAVVNVATGLSSIKTLTFIWVSLVGMAASTFVYVNAGTELAHVRVPADLYSQRMLVSLAALALLPWLIKPIVRRLQPRPGI